MSKRASRRRGKEGQELSDIDTGYTSRSLHGAQREGQKEWDIDTGREVDEDEVDDGDCGRWMLQNVSNMDESVRDT